MAEEKIVGCPDPFSVAESINGERIDWSNEKDSIDAIAECLGITKEGFMQNAPFLLNPKVAVDSKGQMTIRSDKDAEEQVTALLKLHARPQTAVKRSTILPKNTLSVAQKRKNVVNTLVHKQVSDKVKTEMINSGEAVGAANTDEIYMPADMEWRDKGMFFNETVSWLDVCQNSIGDCYFLAALCSAAFANPFLIKNTTALRGKWNSGAGGTVPLSPWHAIDFYVPNSYGNTKEGIWDGKKKSVQTIVASEDVLVHKRSGFNFGVCGPKEKSYRSGVSRTNSTARDDMDSCWAAVYEKAYAKFLERNTSDCPNMNGEINGGNTTRALQEILHTESVSEKYLNDLTESEIWKKIATARNVPMTASIYRYERKVNGQTVYYGKAGTSQEYLQMGLYTWHCYSVLYGTTYDGKKYVVLRNPHGRNPSTLKDNPRVYHKSWGFNFGYNVMDSYRSKGDIYTSITGNDNPLSSNGIFLLELSEFKRVFDSISYYDGPSLTDGSTILVPDEPVKTVKVTNTNLTAITVNIECTDPETGAVTVYKNEGGSLGFNKSVTIDLSSKKLKDKTKVRVGAVRSGKTSYAKSFYYHTRASRTISYSSTLGILVVRS